MPALPSASDVHDRVAGPPYADALVVCADDRIRWARGRGPRAAARERCSTHRAWTSRTDRG